MKAPLEYLDLHLKVLVLEHGRGRVVQSLARICGVSEDSIEAELILAAQRSSQKSPKKMSTSAELLDKIAISDGSKRDALATLLREFENKRFLGEMRLVLKFLREHQVSTVPKTRLSGLPKVLSILANLSQDKLDALVADCNSDASRSGYSHLAGAIMGQKSP